MSWLFIQITFMKKYFFGEFKGLPWDFKRLQRRFTEIMGFRGFQGLLERFQRVTKTLDDFQRRFSGPQGV